MANKPGACACPNPACSGTCTFNERMSGPDEMSLWSCPERGFKVWLDCDTCSGHVTYSLPIAGEAWNRYKAARASAKFTLLQSVLDAVQS